MKYKDEYYNHFTKARSSRPPQFNRNENFLIRFVTPLPYYAYKESSLTIIYFKQGSGILKMNNNTKIVNDDKFIITNPDENWEFINSSANAYLDVLSFAISDQLIAEHSFYVSSNLTSLLDDPSGQKRPMRFFMDRFHAAQHHASGRLLDSIHLASTRDDYAFIDPQELTFEVLDTVLAEQIKHQIQISRIGAKKRSTQLELFDRLLLVYEYIHDNVQSNPTIEELAKTAALSPFHLYSSFKKVFGTTPHKYINQVKMNRAKKILIEGQQSISETAYFLGFPDLPSFSKLFKKTFGTPPSLVN